MILAFPANNFGAQEPGTNQEIKEFCDTNTTSPSTCSPRSASKGTTSILCTGI